MKVKPTVASRHFSRMLWLRVRVERWGSQPRARKAALTIAALDPFTEARLITRSLFILPRPRKATEGLNLNALD